MSNINNLVKYILESKELISKRIQVIESKLNITLPKEYSDFIREYGVYSKNGIEIYGYDESIKNINKIPCVIGATNLYRKDYKLPNNFIVISHSGFEDNIIVLNIPNNNILEVNSAGKFKLLSTSFTKWFNQLDK